MAEEKDPEEYREIDLSGICPTVQEGDEATPIYSEEFGEYVCSGCDGLLHEHDSEVAATQFRAHAIQVSKKE